MATCQQQQKRYPRLAEGKAIGSLMEAFRLLEDRREHKGRRYRLSGLLGVVVCGYFAGCRSLEQCAAFAAALNQRQCRSFGFWRALGPGKLVAPSHTTLWRAICAAQPEAFDKVVETWLRQHQHDAPQAIAIDGKVIRATATPANPEALSVSAISHSLRDLIFFSSLCVRGKNHEPQAVVDLLGKIGPIDGTLVTVDALHCRRTLAHSIVQENGADYLMSVKGNRPALRKAIVKKMDASEVRKIFTLEKGHGRTERRSIAAIDASPTDLTWPFAAQAGRITRERENLTTGKKQIQCIVFVTSQDCTQADSAKLLAQATGHWKIENALHYRKDASMGEDRCYARKWPTISLLATIRSLVITVLGRLKESLPCVPKRLCANAYNAVSFATKPLKIAFNNLS
ncbi:MAG: ISAs1 family transposase [Candidatus Synoicihabitans palmerolidicus]|nr:ISAs1 family transposase [Candidatus Synoicihabitans palmerolidicus]